MAQSTTIEWCVLRRTDGEPVLWRGPLSEVDANDWVDEWEDDGGKPGSFFVGYREVGPWIAPAPGVKVVSR